MTQLPVGIEGTDEGISFAWPQRNRPLACDLARFDLMMSWLASQPGGLADVTPPGVIKKLEMFRKEKSEWAHFIPRPPLVRAAAQVAQEA